MATPGAKDNILGAPTQNPEAATFKTFAPREEKVGLGIPNPIWDWVYEHKKSAGSISDALHLSVLHAKGGNMSSPTFSSPLVAARGRGVCNPWDLGSCNLWAFVQAGTPKQVLGVRSPTGGTSPKSVDTS